MKSFYLITAFLLSLPVFGADATEFRGNPQHTGVYDAPGVPKFSKIKWKFHTNGLVISSPAVANGTVYVGSTDGNLYAVDLGIWYAALEICHQGPSHVVSGSGWRHGLFRKL